MPPWIVRPPRANLTLSGSSWSRRSLTTSSSVEFGLRIETHYVTGAGADAGHVPKIARYDVKYLKCLASDDYHTLMDTALRAERRRRRCGETRGRW
ncbi:hypothetical protein ACP70R_005226 [Stipagrostis hirtigluma subsp. patula]